MINLKRYSELSIMQKSLISVMIAVFMLIFATKVFNGGIGVNAQTGSHPHTEIRGQLGD